LILPQEYTDRMKNLLSDLGPEEFERYMVSLEQERYYGLRSNDLKITPEEWARISPFALEPVPWTENGFYYKEGYPGRHPFYHAGLYYIQEPSAMYPGACLKPEPGDRVLDICAAPGGKSTQLAASMRGQGLLVSNDISEERVHALVKNLEMWGDGELYHHQ
jgi:16S rRNA C967 or C1407 C5-methylase (RsmB/RsmF family)